MVSVASCQKYSFIKFKIIYQMVTAIFEMVSPALDKKESTGGQFRADTRHSRGDT